MPNLPSAFDSSASCEVGAKVDGSNFSWSSNDMASPLAETSNRGPLDRSSRYQCQTGSGQEQADVFRAHLSHDPVARLESPDNTWGKVVKADMYDHVHGSVSQRQKIRHTSPDFLGDLRRGHPLRCLKCHVAKVC